MPHARSSRQAVSLAAVLLVVALWLTLHPPLPFLATSDIYTHLSVARHLADGDGFLCDITYPLSFAFPWACKLPQPLIHRPPGYALLLAPLYLTADGDPQRALERVRWLMALVLAASLWIGFTAFNRHGRRSAIAAWSLLWLSSPLVAFVLGWGQIEAAVGLVLLALWLRWREPFIAPPDALPPRREVTWALPGWLIDGSLCAALALLRPELFWLPFWWWYGLRRSTPSQSTIASTAADAPSTSAVNGRRRRRDALLTLAVWCALAAPWAARNWRVTGDPFFSLQSYAEHVKMTASWPEYTVYRSLDPQPLVDSLREERPAMFVKTRAGMGFFIRQLGNWLPWSLLAGGALLWLARGRWRRVPGEPLFVVGVSGAVLILLYAPFDHELRHLLPLWPVATWELCLLAADALANRGAGPARASSGRASLWQGALLVVVVALGSWLTPSRLPGWQHAAQIAADDLPRTAALIARADALPPGALFCDNAALLWLTGRTGVWAPIDDVVEREIRQRVPQLAHAPRLLMDEE